MHSHDVIGIGGMYLDVVAKVSYKFLWEQGLLVNEEQEVPPNKIENLFSSIDNFDIFPGGSAANTIAGVAKAGGKTGFCSKVAKDEIGKSLVRDFRDRGVELCCSPYDEAAHGSPLCLVLLTPGGERSIAYNSSSAVSFSAKELVDIGSSNSRFILIESALFTGLKPTQGLHHALCTARESGVKIIFNLQGIHSWKTHSPTPSEVASISDIIIGNKAEMACFKALAPLPAFSEQVLITTDGEKGAQAQIGGRKITVDAITPSKIISSVGAGDQFLAGVLRGLSLGLTLRDSMQMGTRMATNILQEKGGRPDTVRPIAKIDIALG